MAEHELPPTRGTLSLMRRLSLLASFAGAAVTCGTWGVVHMAAAALIGVLATFIAFAGLLMLSDWQADAQSRYDWTQIGLTSTHFSLTVETGPASDIIVSDDLGPQIPISAAELEVIETYLGHLLDDLLASSTTKPPSDKS